MMLTFLTLFLALHQASASGLRSDKFGSDSKSYSFECGSTVYLCGGLTSADQICASSATTFVTGSRDECRALVGATRTLKPFSYRCRNGSTLSSYVTYTCDGIVGYKTSSSGVNLQCSCPNYNCGLHTRCDDELKPEQVRNFFSVWNDALLTRDSTTVAKLYSSSPMLLPTVSDIPRTDFEGIKGYFDHFLEKEPSGKIIDGKVTVEDDWAMDGGIYEFYLAATDTTLRARYTYVYIKERDGVWRIAHHHSSQMPEGLVAKPQPITETEVRGLFTIWNNALTTEDPEVVASLYAAKPVLLPTLSNTPRTSKETIINYFEEFLKKKPQGVIVSGDIYIGHNWARDAGIYEFTLGIDNSKLRARYSFVYIYEDGQWKISHHHSSKMPEG